MAKTNKPPLSASAADLLLRQQLRESAAGPPAAFEPDEPANGDAESAWNAENSLRQEMARLETIPGHTNGRRPDPGEHPFHTPNNPHELDSLRRENNELQKLIEELRQIFAQATEQEAENARFIEQLQLQVTELERQLADKEEQLGLFQGQIHELETHIQHAAPPLPSEDELSRMADELEKERVQLSRDRKELDSEREQLRDDEQDMMKQMREMEVQMAKERAEMARQRTELQRLHSEIERELEQLQGSDRAITDRLVQFQRRHQDIVNRSGGQAPVTTKPPAPSEVNLAGPPPATKKDSGLLSRFFNRK